jgi:hypothetical protein
MTTSSKNHRRQNTRLESEGAEFLVLGNLLADGISCYKAYVNFPGYDLFAINPITRRLAARQIVVNLSA